MLLKLTEIDNFYPQPKRSRLLGETLAHITYKLMVFEKLPENSNLLVELEIEHRSISEFKSFVLGI